MRREILSSFCILPASLFHSFTRSVSFPLPLTSLSIFLPRSEPTQFPHPYLFILLSFSPHLFLSFSFSWSPSPHVYPHIFHCPSTLWSKGVWPPYFRCFVRFVDRYRILFYSQHETMTSLFPCERLQHMRLLVHQ